MNLAPTPAQERYEFIDVVRGVALFGIVSANMSIYSLYLYLPDSVRKGMKTHRMDWALDYLELLFIEGKFYTIFSILFGVGFSLLVARSRASRAVFHQFFLRRVFFLFLIGAAHAVLFWHDDILQAYALCGALLLPFVAVRTRTILAFAVLALLAPIWIKLAGGIPSDFFTDAQNALFDRFGFRRDTVFQTWTSGTPGEIVRLNVCQWFSQVSFLITSGMIFQIFGCFLLGFCIGRNEVHQKLKLYRPVIRRIVIGGIAIGLPLNFFFAVTYSSNSWLRVLSGTFGILPLSAGYASLLCLIWLNSRGRELLRHFAPVGRMALTNYVGQSVICTLVFYGTGLGLGGTMGPTLYLPMGFAVYGLQVVASRWWLDRFRFGPLEWLWRMLTYGAFFPLRKRAEC